MNDNFILFFTKNKIIYFARNAVIRERRELLHQSQQQQHFQK